MKTKKPDILILGLGNYLMGDEGVGCHMVKELEFLNYGDEVELLDGGTSGFMLMEHLVDHQHVILIDATMDDFPEGTVRVIRPTSVRDFPVTMSTHEIGLKDLITSLTLLEKLPDLYLITVSVKDLSNLSVDLSDKVRDAIPQVKEKLDKILDFLQEPERA